MTEDQRDEPRGALPVFLAFLRLGLTSFGGPVAHIGYFREEFVSRRRWLGERAYADLVALCQFLPGPASSQVGMALGLSRAGYAGAFAAWAGFTLPSAILLVLFALGVGEFGDRIPAGVLNGLKVVAVAVVAQAVWGMTRSLCIDGSRIAMMVVACWFASLFPSAWTPLGVIAAAGVAGLLLFRPAQASVHDPLPIAVGRRAALGSLGLFFVLLVALPLLARLGAGRAVELVDAFFRAGALVFGGGHVVLPLLQWAVVPPGWVGNEAFLAGYGAAQAVPGPLFTFAAYLGASLDGEVTGWAGGALCLAAIFLPAYLLVAGALPFWEALRRNVRAQAALAGVNAAVVGLLVAALYDPVWTSAIHGLREGGLALAAYAALMFAKAPPWLVVVASGVAGWMLGL